MAITTTLVEATKNRLRYLLAHGTGADAAVLTTTGIGTVDSDLRLAARSAQRDLPDWGLVTVAEARAWLASDDPTKTYLTNPLQLSAVYKLTPRNVLAGRWGADVWVVGGPPGPPCIRLMKTGAHGGVAYCYFDIYLLHTLDL